jgi:predicted helicase
VERTQGLTILQYLKTIQTDFARGNATEHTHRPALKALIESLSDKITATNEPQRIKCGAPDFIVTRGEVPLGYIEAKDIGESLDNAQKSEQLERYRESLGNLILTDYLEFRWFVRPRPSKDNPFPESEHRLTARLAHVGANGKLLAEADAEQQVVALLNAFLDAKVPTVQSAKELAVRMAALARLIRDTIRRVFSQEGGTGTLHVQMKGFRQVLLHDLSEDQFADMYAQTICYGLFAGRCNAKGSEHFTREHAAYDLPKTNPFLRKMFNHIAGPDLDERIAWAVDDLAELLHRANISAILQDFGKRTRREDPVVHFYETFLAAYDPRMREARGVYYTPEPVVSYIVRSIDHILKTDFKLPDGLADSSKISVKNPKGKGKIDIHKVLILDPATGTGTFLYSVINHIFESFKKNLGMWSGYVSEHLLPRLFGFELLMAPYAVAHMKLGLLLDETGYDFKLDERLRVYLTNTLEEAHEYSGLPLFAAEIAEEANEASLVKQEAPVMVVLGNPPYSGHSANAGEWISGLLRGNDSLNKVRTSDYFKVDGQPLGERNPKWLNDDYVKFIRFAQWRIEQTGYGVLAFITNHGYLDNPTFRGMRQSLMETFDDIYVLDLHGSTKKNERAPDGTKDDNVFDIQPGVAIGIFVKRKGKHDDSLTVRHAHLWGPRAIYDQDSDGRQVLIGGKYHWLSNNDVTTTRWTAVKPQSPFYLFIAQDEVLAREFALGGKITDILTVNVLGFQTHRDFFAIDFDEGQLRTRIEDLRNSEYSDDELRSKYELRDSEDWQLANARQQLRNDEAWEKHFIECLYRPFDWRASYFSKVAMDRPRRELVDNVVDRNNLSLLCSRQQGTLGFRHAWVAKEPANDCVVSTTSREANQVFPLYLYSREEGLLEASGQSLARSRRPNISQAFIEQFAAGLQLTFIPEGKGDRSKTFGPEDVFDYIYAVLHSPTYRSRYGEFLKIDFPRLPLTSNVELFRELCALGSQMVVLHLMEKHAAPITTFPLTGSNEVDKVRYTAPGEAGSDEGRVWINSEQYFEGVPPEVWNFLVGGYQVCQKWLKDRKGRQLTYDDLNHYQNIVSALNETIRLMSEIDEAIEEHGSWPIQ